MVTVAYSTNKGGVYINEYNKHIKSTCGLSNIQILPYENYGEKSLFQVYNNALKDAKYDIVFLIHDDLVFLERKQGIKNNWALKCKRWFNEGYCDVLGIAGTTYLDNRLGGMQEGMWWRNGNRGGLSPFMVGKVYHQNAQYGIYVSNYCKQQEYPIDSVLIDGCFMVFDKNILRENDIWFDENSYTEKFHFYDLDISLQCYNKGLNICVTTELEVLHKSQGNIYTQNNDGTYSIIPAYQKNRDVFVNKFNSIYHTIPDVRYDINEENKAIKNILNSKEELPLLSIIILTKNKFNLLSNLLNSICVKTKYPKHKIEILIADTGSDNVLELYELVNNFELNIKIIEYDYYSFAEINNDVVLNHVSDDSELILFSNNDIVLINDSISQMVDVYLKNKTKIGTIGCRLHYENNTIQHSGIIFKNVNNNLMVTHYGLYKIFDYFDSTINTSNNNDIIGSTGAFLMINKELFKETLFNIAYLECLEDVELNLNLLIKDKINYFVGNAVNYHLESQTRKGGIVEEDWNLLVYFINNNMQKLHNKLK